MRFSPAGTAIAFLPAMVFLARWFFHPIRHVYSGDLFADTRIVTGGALDQDGLLKGVVIFCFVTTILTGYVLAVRFLFCNRENRATLRVWAGMTSLLFLHPLTILFIILYHLVRYLHAMGPTRQRLLALLFVLISFAAIGLFLRWIWRPILRPPKTALSSASSGK